jgi:predicted AAA+ superfamily ATPase
MSKNDVLPFKKRASLATNSKAELVIALIENANKAYKFGKDYWRKNFAYTVVVSERDTLYSEVHTWLIAAFPHEKHKALAVGSSKSVNIVEPETPEGHIAKPLIVRFNDNTSRKVVIEGHNITVTLNTPEVSDNQYREPAPAKIEFLATSHEGQQAVIRLLEKLNSERATSRKAVLKMVGQWGNWSTRSDLPPRTMASVSLPEEQKTRVMKDLETFLGAEDQYNRLAIPWHRGYMFYGPPGTGKTSLVKALANEFNLDLWYVSLSDLKAESGLLSLLADVGPRSLLLLEDIDTIQITHDRDSSEQGKISMGSLLNTLDGVATPHGLITVMTTNRFELLDPALTRAGRMDLIEKLDYPTLRTIGNLFDHFFGTYMNGFQKMDFSRDLDAPLEGVSTAEIAEILKRHMDDRDLAKKTLATMFDEILKDGDVR